LKIKNNVYMKTLIMFLSFLFFGCQTPQKKAEEHSLIGEWRNLTLQVELNKKNGEPTDTFSVDERTWELTLNIRPIRTYFRSDSTFNSEHFNLNDSLILNPEGIWFTNGDQITMITQQPFNDTTECSYSISSDVATFGCWVDWDEDGDKDDWYVGTQRKF